MKRISERRIGSERSPLSVKRNRIILWPTPAVGPNMHAQPPSTTAIPCLRL
jgi:hypothetical protein